MDYDVEWNDANQEASCLGAKEAGVNLFHLCLTT